MLSSRAHLRSIVVIAAMSALVLGACSSERSRGEGYLFVEEGALLLCELVEPDPATCVGPIFGADTFSVLDSTAVQMAEQGEVRYSLERVELVQTDPDPDFASFRAIPLNNDE